MKQMFLDEFTERDEEDVYSKEMLQEFVDDDEISGTEEGFMIGYLS